MPTDDERRAVARRLRDSAEERMAVKGTGNGNNWSWLYRSIFGHYMGTKNGAKGHYVEVAHRLADLIEPESERTCRVESSHEEESDGCYWYFEYELTCGHEIAWGDQLPPSYCPECGRRVLYDSDDYI